MVGVGESEVAAIRRIAFLIVATAVSAGDRPVEHALRISRQLLDELQMRCR